jgi:WD40 repeat protein
LDRVFISYSRKDKEFVRRLHAALKGHGIDAWVDWEDIPLTADWQQEVYAGIDAAETFVAVLSPDALFSEVCLLELQHATRYNKRIIPIVCRDVDPRQVPPELARHNWLFLRDGDSFDEGIDVLVDAINTDLEWVRAHTRILVRAAEWESSEHNSSFLMRGADLRKAEAWLSKASPDQLPSPTALHTRYVLASRKSERNQLRLITGIALLSSVVAMFLTFYAWSERSQAIHNADLRATAEAISQTRLTEAERQQKIALSLQLAAQSRERLTGQLDLSILLAVEANKAKDTAEAKSSLLQALQYSPHLEATLRGHTGAVESLADSFSLAASGGEDGTIRLWDPDTGNPMGAPLKGHTSAVKGLAFSADGETLASSGLDGTIILWNVGTHEPLAPPLHGGHGDSQELAFSPDGKTLAAFSVGRNVTLWDLSASPPVTRTHLVQAPVLDVDFTPEGKAIAAASWHNSILLWDVAADVQIGDALVGHTSDVTRAAFSADCKLLASSGGDGTIIVWNVEAQHSIAKFRALEGGGAANLAFNSDATLVAVADQTNAITLWEVGTQSPISTPFLGHTASVTGMEFSYEGGYFFSGSKDGTVMWWNPHREHTLGESLIWKTPPGNPFSVAFSPDGKTIASGNQDKNIALWDVATRVNTGMPLEGHADWVRNVAFAADGKLMASGGEDKLVIVWDMSANPPAPRTQPGHTDGVLGVAFSPDSRLLASASRDKSIILWDADSGKPIGQPMRGHKGVVTSVAFSPDGKLLASASWDKTVILWDVATRKQLGEPLTGHKGNLWSVAFSPDGRLLASAGEDKSIILWDVATRKPTGQPLTGHADTINSIAFSPDGKLLASGSADGTVNLWDLAARLKINPPLGWDSHSISGVAFSPDGKELVSVGAEAPVLWDVDPESWQDRACKIAARNLTHEEWQRYMGDSPYRETCPNLP